MQDILLDDTYDIMIANGDLVIDDTDLQNQNLLLVCNKGSWKENPTVCVGVARWLKDDVEPSSDLLGEIKKEFQRDGMTVNQLTLDATGTLDIDANY